MSGIYNIEHNVMMVTFEMRAFSIYTAPPFCLFDFIFYIASTIFQLNRDMSSRVEPVLS